MRTHEELVKIQLQLEKESKELAYSRMARDMDNHYRNGSWGESKAGRRFVRSGTSTYLDAIKAFLTPSKTRGRRVIASKMLIATGLSPETLAFLTTKAIYNEMALSHRSRAKRVTVCRRIADMVHDEWRIQWFAQHGKEFKHRIHKEILRSNKRGFNRQYKKHTLQNLFDAEKLEWSGWNHRERILVGYALMLLFRDATGLIVTGGENPYVYPSPALLTMFESDTDRMALTYAIYRPMVVPPNPWSESNLFRGAYLSEVDTKPYPIIKRMFKKDYLRICDSRWEDILPAVNAIQETPWRVNKKVLDVLEYVMVDYGGNVAGLPSADPLPIPTPPPGMEKDSIEGRFFRSQLLLIHNENRKLIGKRVTVLTTIALAKRFAEFERIYFPHNMDNRGRIYPLPAFLNPQGPDYVKALLEFADGKPINDKRSEGWLAIATANAYGNDKVSLEDRIQWVWDNEDMISSVAKNPTEDLSWLHTGEPFQFLRCCMEWVAYREHGPGYVSHMPVPVDATCSGIQHYSAMLRDEIGGRSVNLVPGLPRQDIYQAVADKVIDAMMQDGPELAKLWLRFGINRKITKRQVMVVPYAGTFRSCLDYTREAVLEAMEMGGKTLPEEFCPNGSRHNEGITYLSSAIWKAIDDTVVKGKEAMRWISEVNRAYSRYINATMPDAHITDRALSWTTPDGLIVLQKRPKLDKKQLSTTLDGRVQLVYYENQDTLSPRDMATSCPPNFIHSLDACHLRMAVRRAVEKGIHSFAMVHDSFGTHAASMDTFLNECIKPTFVEMYREDIIASLAVDLPYGLEIPPLPEMGKLDLERIPECEFAFS